MNIRPMQQEDAAAVLEIYAEGIDDRIATFEIKCPSWEDWDNNHAKSCRLVAESDGKIVGWAALSPVSRRACYAGVAEVSVYIARSARGRGAGLALLGAVVKASEQAGYWTLQGSTFEENAASLKIQQQCGFRVVGTRERVSKLDGQWRTTVITERRSNAVGVD